MMADSKKKSQFELDNHLRRLIKELANLYENNENIKQGIEFKIQVYSPDDTPTIESEENLQLFWEYLEKKKAVEINKEYSTDGLMVEPTTYKDKPFVYQRDYYLKIIKVRPIKKLYSIAKYNFNTDELYFMGKVTKFRPNTKQLLLCRSLFQREKGKLKKILWNWDELLEDWDENINLDDYKEKGRVIVDSAAMGVNKKVFKATGIDNFLIRTTKTVKINPFYL